MNNIVLQDGYCNSSKRKLPTKKAIREFWGKTSLWRFGGGGFDSSCEFLEDDYCFACGLLCQTERCHIIPRCKGGNDSTLNLHLLCGVCHRKSEFLENENSYYYWFFNRTREDRDFDAISEFGFSYSDFKRGDKHLLTKAVSIFGRDACKKLLEAYPEIPI